MIDRSQPKGEVQCCTLSISDDIRFLRAAKVFYVEKLYIPLHLRQL